MTDGEERDHFRELLVEVHTMMKSHLEDYKQHKIDDKEHFQRIYGMTGDLRKYLYMGMGALAAFELAIKFFKE